jgi:Phosphoenolpyruvate carboxylase
MVISITDLQKNVVYFLHLKCLLYLHASKMLISVIFFCSGNPRVTPEVTRDVCLLARLMAANLYFAQIEDLMFEVHSVFTT